MFDGTIKALEGLTKIGKISVSIQDDEEDYFDRECPSEDCLFQFKILSEDWKNKVSDEAVHCPNCGHVADSDKWWTKEQIEHAKQVALAQISSRIFGALRKDAENWNRNQPKNSFISMTIKVDNTPRQISLPPAVIDPMRLKITCPKCDCHYAVIGAAYFCPACGHNSAEQQFRLSLNGIRQSLNALDDVRAAISDKDVLKNTILLIVENGLQNAVTAFQRCVEAKYCEVDSTTKIRRNAFQNLAEGSQIWKDVIGKGYDEFISADDLFLLKRAFQQRHLLAHTQGIVDENYLVKTNDQRYKIGQRIVVKTEEVLACLQLVEKLVEAIILECKSKN